MNIFRVVDSPVFFMFRLNSMPSDSGVSAREMLPFALEDDIARGICEKSSPSGSEIPSAQSTTTVGRPVILGVRDRPILLKKSMFGTDRPRFCLGFPALSFGLGSEQIQSAPLLGHLVGSGPPAICSRSSSVWHATFKETSTAR